MHCAVSSDCSFCIALNQWVVYYCDISYHVAHTHSVCMVAAAIDDIPGRGLFDDI